MVHFFLIPPSLFRYVNILKVHKMQYITCEKLINCSGKEVSIQKVLKNKQQILFYFDASWTEGNKEMLLKVKSLFEAIRQSKIRMEIIYVSSDTDNETWMKNFISSHHGWHAIPFGSNTIWELILMYNITHVPEMVVVKPDGTLITKHGIDDFNKLRNNVLVKWSDAIVT